MKPFIKNFLGWLQLKPKIDSYNKTPPFVKEGEVYWFHCGENIGFEICGKNNDFMRPCIIYKKLSRHLFLVIPTSTKIKEGTWFSFFSFKKISQVACLHQIKVVDFRRLENYIGELPEHIFQAISEDFEILYTKNKSP